MPLLAFCILVPTARLELAQLAPLPPQDSVSTNFTTSAGDQYFTLPYHFISMHKLRYHKEISQLFNFEIMLIQSLHEHDDGADGLEKRWV